MRRNTLFWGVILIVGGGLLLLSNMGLLRGVNVWGLLWPLFLILAGGWILLGVLGVGRPNLETEAAAVPLEGATQAVVRVHHGAGRLVIGGGASAGNLLSGTFGGGVETRKHGGNGALDIDLRSRVEAWTFWTWPWGGRGALDWTFGLTRDVPLELRLETGASESRIDLGELKVTDVRLQTGASSTELCLPANAGNTRVRVEAGAASVVVRVPGGVAAQIRAQAGLASVTVDQTRFPRNGSYYQSPDYATAANKVDISVEVGVGSVDIR